MNAAINNNFYKNICDVMDENIKNGCDAMDDKKGLRDAIKNKMFKSIVINETIIKNVKSIAINNNTNVIKLIADVTTYIALKDVKRYDTLEMYKTINYDRVKCNFLYLEI